MSKRSSQNSSLLSIGNVADETGLSPDVLRAWERRYGAPQPVRLPSGHRRYSREEMERLQLVVQALHAGFRPGQVVSTSRDDLMKLLVGDADGLERASSLPFSRPLQLSGFLREWVEASLRFDESALTSGIHKDWLELGPLAFIEDRVIPFLDYVGASWARGDFSVAAEHFASARIRDFLASQWRRLNERAPGSKYLFAKLPGDQHDLGLQMAALIATSTDQKVAYLGKNTPVNEVARAAREISPAAICLSISSGNDARWTRRWLRQLRESLHSDLSIVVGGAGVPTELPDGVLHISSFKDFHRWLKEKDHVC